MTIVGRFDLGDERYVLQADQMLVGKYVLAKDGLLSKGSAYLDGKSDTAAAAQVAKMVVYDASGVLVAVSDEITVQEGQDLAVVDFPFSPPYAAMQLAAGVYQVGVHGGDSGGTIRVYGSDPHGFGSVMVADAYSGGPANPISTEEALTFSGGIITDVVRAAGVEGDLLPLGSGVGIWPATTNQILNGGFETNVSNWTPLDSGGSTLTRQTADHAFGTACGEFAITGTW